MNAIINHLLTIDETRTILRIGRNAMYKLIKEQTFPSFRISNQIRIPKDALLIWIEKSTIK